MDHTPPRRMFSKFLLLHIAMATTLAGGEAADRLRLGEEALAAGLWEIAAGHFEACLADPDVTGADKSAVAIRLAESRLRDGRPGEVLSLLEEPTIASHPEAPFWKGQALAATGEAEKAIDVFTPLIQNPLAPYHAEAVFTAANLEIEIGETSAALHTLGILESGDDPALATKARLRRVELLLDLDRVAEAREALPQAGEVAAADLPLHAFLEASVLLREGKPGDAATLFRGLIDQPQGQSLHRHHLAAVGLADALLASQQQNSCAAFLLSFLRGQPDSPQLEALFERLRVALQENGDSETLALDALSEWTTSSEIPAVGPVAIADAGCAGAWSVSARASEITAYALYTRALLLRYDTGSEHTGEIRRLFTRLRMEFPTHPLAARSLLELALIELDAGRRERALLALDALKQLDASDALRGRAAFIEAEIAYADGDRQTARREFLEAADYLPGNQAGIARFNAVIPVLAETDEEGALTTTGEPGLAADLQLERALATASHAERVAAIDAFLIAHPDHPRGPEARLAAAEAALSTVPPDLSLARAQLETLDAEPEKASALDAARLAMVRLQLADLAGDAENAIAVARDLIAKFPDTTTAAEATLVLGRNLFQSEAYNEARMVLEQLAATTSDPARAEASRLMAARSAALVPTSQSQQEALALFRAVIDADGPLAPLARLESARLMIDMNRLDEAADFLRGWFGSLDQSDPLRLPAGLLLGEAIYARGSASPTSLADALAVYDSLLAETAPHSGLFNRLQYLRGRTLEQIPNERAAFAAYYSVLETDEAPADWHYFELCGFRALALLEKSARWPAAIACARKIASFNGPRAAEATERASQLQLKHMIWED